MRGKAGRKEQVSDEKMSALRQALRKAPRKRVKAARGSLKAAVAQLLPDLLGFRAKGYTGVELAAVLREHGVVISAGTLTKYLAELRPSSARKQKRAAVEPQQKPQPKPAVATPVPPQAAPPARIVAPLAPALRFVAKPLPRRSKASDVLGHRFDDDV
ncbi:MAG TPA: hypothetical protein VEH76_09630 [Methylocystis sp.]|nr:hypothetical protein [Methylocystis sp.]